MATKDDIIDLSNTGDVCTPSKTVSFLEYFKDLILNEEELELTEEFKRLLLIEGNIYFVCV